MEKKYLKKKIKEDFMGKGKKIKGRFYMKKKTWNQMK